MSCLGVCSLPQFSLHYMAQTVLSTYVLPLSMPPILQAVPVTHLKADLLKSFCKNPPIAPRITFPAAWLKAFLKVCFCPTTWLTSYDFPPYMLCYKATWIIFTYKSFLPLSLSFPTMTLNPSKAFMLCPLTIIQTINVKDKNSHKTYILSLDIICNVSYFKSKE